MGSRDKTKIMIGRQHVAYVQSDLLYEFRRENGIINFPAWLRKTVYEAFNIDHLEEKESIDKLNKAVRLEKYNNVGEWLQNIMRDKGDNVLKEPAPCSAKVAETVIALSNNMDEADQFLPLLPDIIRHCDKAYLLSIIPGMVEAIEENRELGREYLFSNTETELDVLLGKAKKLVEQGS